MLLSILKKSNEVGFEQPVKKNVYKSHQSNKKNSSVTKADGSMDENSELEIGQLWEQKQTDISDL